MYLVISFIKASTGDNKKEKYKQYKRKQKIHQTFEFAFFKKINPAEKKESRALPISSDSFDG